MRKNRITKISYAIMDGRYAIASTRSKAICHLACDSLSEARKQQFEWGDDSIIVKHWMEQKPDRTWEILFTKILK